MRVRARRRPFRRRPDDRPGPDVASYAAFVLGEEIVSSDVLDARFCEKVDLKQQDGYWPARAGPISCCSRPPKHWGC